MASESAADKSKVVCELLYVAFNAVLFQRGVYPRAQFRRTKKWGLPIIVTDRSDVDEYLLSVVAQVRKLWLTQQPGARNEAGALKAAAGTLNEVALTIADSANQPVEKWAFEFSPVVVCGPPASDTKVRSDLQALLRQVGASITFLPLLHGAHTFRMTVCERVDTAAACPKDWMRVDPAPVPNAERGAFHTITVHDVAVQLKVVYALASW